MGRILNIELFGELYKFKADPGDDNAEKAINLLKSKVESDANLKSVPKNEINKFAQLLLATLNICNEYLDMKDKYDSLLHNVNERSSKIVNAIDKGIK